MFYRLVLQLQPSQRNENKHHTNRRRRLKVSVRTSRTDGENPKEADHQSKQQRCQSRTTEKDTRTTRTRICQGPIEDIG